MTNRLVLDPALMVRLVALLTPAEDQQLLEYATQGDRSDFPFRSTEWLLERFNLKPAEVGDVPEDTILIVRRILLSRE